MGMIPEGYTVNHYLVDNDAFFIKTDIPNGFKLFQDLQLEHLWKVTLILVT